VGKRARTPKRLFRAIVACGVALTACGDGGPTSDGGANDAASASDAKHDAAADAHVGFDASVDAAPDAYEPSDASVDDVVTIKPPPPTIH